MLREWLGPVSLEGFRNDYLQRSPLAQPSTTLGSSWLLTWEVLGNVLANKPDVPVVARGELLDLPPPRCLIEARAYLRLGVGLCIRHAQLCDAGLRCVADAFETDVGPSQVQVFVTPGSTHGLAGTSMKRTSSSRRPPA